MSSNEIFIGNIRKCTNFVGESLMAAGGTCYSGFELDSEIYKENALLYRTKSGRYVDIDLMQSLLMRIVIKRHESIDKIGLLMPTVAYSEGSLYVDKTTLKPYYRDKKIIFSIKQLKKELQK